MTLKAVLDTLEGVNEALQPFYAEKDGKFILQVEGMQHDADVNGLKSALVKERENAGKYAKLGTPEEIAEKFAGHDEALKEASRGNDKTEQFQAKIKQMEEAHASELTERDLKFSKLQSGIAISELKAELAKAGVIPDGIDMVAGYSAARIKFHDDGSPKIMTKDGSSPMIGNGADGGATLADLAKELAEANPYLVADEGKGGGGKPPESAGGKPAHDNPLAAKVPGFADLPEK
ncbi:hypothetical protein RA19_00215 [Leisingera sp. ANG-M1]|uniref:hypothetical protein n=1 Tax=Leisingera sp. ANG-M1 TaxID=1577895 RepID=UPI00057C913B|nr:hypothetical protein [Leisingera sp. ANG-M1]KIC12866.1 hypothetical protein RA19_00215 [Leisingera sp. ANG-M1]